MTHQCTSDGVTFLDPLFGTKSLEDLEVYKYALNHEVSESVQKDRQRGFE